jgi:acyl-CoA synthetase
VRPGATLTPEEVLQHLFDVGLSRYDMPEYFLQLDAFPLTASGKVLKRELADWARTGRLQPQSVRWVERTPQGV